MDAQKKLFAFKLADKQAIAANRNKQWKIRDGIASAQFCTGPSAALQYIPVAVLTDSSTLCH